MCKWNDHATVRIGDREVAVDKCIAPIVQGLNDGGVTTAMSCCGHGLARGFIMLSDGRLLAILPKEAFEEEGYRDTAEHFDNKRLRAGR